MEDEFEVEFEIGRALHQISRNHDVGSHNTASVPIKSNPDLLKLVPEGYYDYGTAIDTEVLEIDGTSMVDNSVLLNLIPKDNPSHEEYETFEEKEEIKGEDITKEFEIEDIANSLYYFIRSSNEQHPVDAYLVTLDIDNDDDNDFSETVDPTVDAGNPLRPVLV